MTQEIKKSLFFLAGFLGFYLVVNVLYGGWVTHYEPRPDPATVAVTTQATWVLGVLGYDVRHVTHAKKAAERILLENRPVIAVHEGCNGINVWIIFTGFMMALRVFTRRTLVFWLCGTVILHLANLVRILLLFGVSLTHPEKVYFFHKYFFTAALYVVVFGLWYYWIKYGKSAGAKTS